MDEAKSTTPRAGEPHAHHLLRPLMTAHRDGADSLEVLAAAQLGRFALALAADFEEGGEAAAAAAEVRA